ncbi:MAG: molecular chaperone DnaJ [Acidobacteriota bacterium]
MDRSDYYALLGVKRRASSAEIRRAFRKLARKYHPDINPGDRVAETHYRWLCEAYEVLSNREERDRYDRLGAQPAAKPAEPVTIYGFEGFDFSLTGVTGETETSGLFTEIFRSQHSRARNGGEVPGEDLQHRLSISFEESLRGLRASFQIARLIACSSCAGWGEVASGRHRTCSACGGRGKATQARGHMLFGKPCPECDGSGLVDREPCPDCRGVGRRAREQAVQVEIPPGVEEGSRVALPGRGHEGRGGGRTGDLYVLIHVAPHPFFSRKGDNLFCTLPVTFSEAALGCRLEVPTIEGSVRVRVPAGVQSGQELRLSGRGAPSLRGAGRGDLFVTVKVVTPVVYDERSKEILRELARLHPENPREQMASQAVDQREVLR